MSNVFVIDTDYNPLDPVHPGYARRLLKQGKAAVYRRYPFTIVLKRVVEEPQMQPLRLKLDPGSKTTGIALVDDGNGKVVFALNLLIVVMPLRKALMIVVWSVATDATAKLVVESPVGRIEGARRDGCLPP